MANIIGARDALEPARDVLLAGGIVGVAVPVMLQSPLATDFTLLRVGSGLLMFTIAVGAIFDAIDERRTAPLVLYGAMGIQRSAALALAEDAKLAAAQVGVSDPRLEAQECEAKAEVQKADSAMTRAGETFRDTSTLESVLFFGSFVVGVLLLTLAVGRANPGAG